MMPLAPGRVSMTNCCPICAVSLLATMRPMMSGELPGAFETTMRTGRRGYGRSAATLAPTHSIAASTIETDARTVMSVSLVIHRATGAACRHDEVAADGPRRVGGEKGRDVSDLFRVDHAANVVVAR